MITAELPENEEERLRQLHELGVLDTLEEQAYDDLTKLAAQICGTPIALVSLIDQDRQWFKSHLGLGARETPRDFAFCAHAILGDEVFVVEDARQDDRFHDNPLTTDEPHVIFYAGAPLIMSDDIKLGTLCVIGNEARTITLAQQEALQALARQVVSQLELRLKVKALELLDHAKDEFVSMVNHELRTPLTSIFGSLSLLVNNQAGTLNEKQKGILDISYRNTQRLIGLVNDILDLAKLESGKLEIENEIIDLQDVVEKSVQLNEQFCKACCVELAFTRAGEGVSCHVEGDEKRLLQVLSNLISNAAKFSNDNDVIEIHISNSNGFAVVEVTDHGPGIPVDQQKLLFEKFKQIHSSGNNKMPGTGLGLTICKNIIELQNGEIGYNSRPGVNTTFFFKLPVVDAKG